MRKFEYRVGTINLHEPGVEGGDYYVQEWLNQQGDKGWELVTAKIKYPFYNFFMKREYEARD